MTRLFTVREAERLLPEVAAALEEIRALGGEVARGSDRMKLLDVLWGEKVLAPGNPDREEFLREEEKVGRGVDRIRRIVEDRILSLGVRFPAGGAEHGLVDFPTRFEGRTVYLCWRLGEERILAWHEVDAGFAGRRPLTDEEAHAMGREPGLG